MRLYTCKCYLACTVILGSVSDIFRYIRALLKSILTHVKNHVCIPGISKPWHNPIIKHIQRHIYNTVLNIFSKAPSWTFDTILNALISFI